MDENIVPEADQHIGLAGHGRMHGMAGELVAEQAVAGVGGRAADDVAGVDVADLDGNPFGGEISRNALAQENADILGPDVARGVARRWFVRHQVLPGALGDHHHRVLARQDAPLQGGQKTVLAVELERDFGDQREIDLLARHTGAGGNEAGIATHQLDHADAVAHSACLRMGAGEYLARSIQSGDVAERTPDVVQVVVDGLGNADDRERIAAARGFRGDGVGAALRSVAADAEQHVDAFGAQEVHDDLRVLRSARGAEHRAAELVHGVDEIRRQQQWRLAERRVQTLVAVADAIDLAHAVVVVELQEDRANHVVQPGAESAAGHDRRTCRRRVEEHVIARAGPLEGQRGIDRPIRQRARLVQHARGIGKEIAVAIAPGDRELQGGADRARPEVGDDELLGGWSLHVGLRDKYVPGPQV